MNNQQIFEKAVTHMLDQGERCYNPNTDLCLYRGDDGNKCAVGCLIPDDAYSPEMDKYFATSGVRKNTFVQDALKGAGIDLEKSMDLLARLQDLHDEPDSWKGGRLYYSAVEIVAEDHSLTIPTHIAKRLA